MPENINPLGSSTVTIASATETIGELLNVLSSIADISADQFSSQQPTLVAAVNNLKSDLSSQRAAQEAAMNAADAQIAQLTSINANLVQDHQALLSQITSLKGQVLGLQQQVATLEAQIAALKKLLPPPPPIP